MNLENAENKKPTYRYLLAFGSNLGQREKNCMRGLDFLLEFSKLYQRSPLMETKPLVFPEHTPTGEMSYINMVCELGCFKKPDELYESIVQIENLIGHSRKKKYLPRKLDIDILLWAKNSSSKFSDCSPLRYSKGLLQVPHQALLERDFLYNLSQLHLNIQGDIFLKHHNCA